VCEAVWLTWQEFRLKAVSPSSGLWGWAVGYSLTPLKNSLLRSWRSWRIFVDSVDFRDNPKSIFKRMIGNVILQGWILAVTCENGGGK